MDAWIHPCGAMRWVERVRLERSEEIPQSASPDPVHHAVAWINYNPWTRAPIITITKRTEHLGVCYGTVPAKIVISFLNCGLLLGWNDQCSTCDAFEKSTHDNDLMTHQRQWSEHVETELEMTIMIAMMSPSCHTFTNFLQSRPLRGLVVPTGPGRYWQLLRLL